MESTTDEIARGDHQAARARQLLQELERVMREIQADLDAAEAKLGRNREPIAHRQLAAIP